MSLFKIYLFYWKKVHNSWRILNQITSQTKKDSKQGGKKQL